MKGSQPALAWEPAYQRRGEPTWRQFQEYRRDKGMKRRRTDEALTVRDVLRRRTPWLAKEVRSLDREIRHTYQH